MNALERLKEACSMVAQQKEIELPDESKFDFWMTPLTIAERQRAQKQSRTDDPIDFALQVLINKAVDENGTPMFPAGNAAEIRNALPAAVVDKLIMVLLSDEKPKEEDEEEASPKSLRSNSKRTGT